jgi:hypothetical protein
VSTRIPAKAARRNPLRRAGCASGRVRRPGARRRPGRRGVAGADLGGRGGLVLVSQSPCASGEPHDVLVDRAGSAAATSRHVGLDDAQGVAEQTVGEGELARSTRGYRRAPSTPFSRCRGSRARRCRARQRRAAHRRRHARQGRVGVGGATAAGMAVASGPSSSCGSFVDVNRTIGQHTWRDTRTVSAGPRVARSEVARRARTRLAGGVSTAELNGRPAPLAPGQPGASGTTVSVVYADRSTIKAILQFTL